MNYQVLPRLLLSLCLGAVTTSAALTAESAALTQIKQDGRIRMGMYLGFEGLSFIQKGKKVGLEVELAQLVCEELSKDLGREVQPEIVNQEWAQIIQELRNGKYHTAFSAVIPAQLYATFDVAYTRSYLDTGPVICCQEKDGGPGKAVTAKVASLADKRVVVINDPAVRRALRRCGVYVPADDGKTDLEHSFPKAATEAAVLDKAAGLIAVKELLQIDEMPVIYKMLAEGEVDAGVIDLGIIWWVANDSERWAARIYAFDKPIGPYIYSAVTRSEDADLSKLLDAAIGRAKASPRYQEILKRWHGGADPNWKLAAEAFFE
ncbi:MAG: transporter substrate-binding domain-containing protein [Planctomycetes bacterium]|nr:transporter substrate-binding domain-containing protein [Planctomycetota bacterium]